MTALFQPPRHGDPEPPMAEHEHGENRVTVMDEPEKDAPERKEEAPKERADEPVEEQHDSGHGDIHRANEVWR